MTLYADTVLLNDLTANSGLQLKSIYLHNLDDKDLTLTVATIQRPDWVALMNVETGSRFICKRFDSMPLTLVINTSHLNYPVIPLADQLIYLSFIGGENVTIKFYNFPFL